MLWLLYLPVERRLFMIMMGEEADVVRRSDRKTVYFCSSAAVRISALFNGARGLNPNFDGIRDSNGIIMSLLLKK